MIKKAIIGAAILGVIVTIVLLGRPRRGVIRCFGGKPYLSLDTVSYRKFVESIPFTAYVTADTVLGKMNVNAELDELYISRVSPGMKALSWLNHKEHLLTVSTVDNTVTNGRFTVALSFPDSLASFIKQNKSLRMHLQMTEPKDATLIQVGGFYKDTGGKYIYVVLPNKKVVKRNIVLGNKNPEYFEVLSGLTPGEVVITSSYENFEHADTLDLERIHKLYDD